MDLRQRHIVQLTAKMHLFLKHGELAKDEKESEKAPETKIRSLQWRPNMATQHGDPTRHILTDTTRCKLFDEYKMYDNFN